MKVAVFDTHRYDQEALEAASVDHGHEIVFFEPRLNSSTAVLARGFRAVCSFINDRLDEETLGTLRQGGTDIVALRSAGYNHVDLAAAAALGMTVVRVPEYSPHAVAEHAVALLLSLNRRIHRAYNRVRDANFSLEGLVGFDLYGKTIGVMGTGRIGAAFCRIMRGFGCTVIAHDAAPSDLLAAEGGIRYASLAEVYAVADESVRHRCTRQICPGQHYRSAPGRGAAVLSGECVRWNRGRRRCPYVIWRQGPVCHTVETSGSRQFSVADDSAGPHADRRIIAAA